MVVLMKRIVACCLALFFIFVCTGSAKADQVVVIHQLTLPSGVNSFNARVAANILSGKLIQPGEIFSFNQAVGQRTKSKGFVDGIMPVKKGGKIVNLKSMGSGVCRLSTAIFQTVKKAGFEIIERHAHQVPVHYAKPGEDATVYYGSLDLKFKNNRSYPIQIIAEVDKKNVCQIQFTADEQMVALAEMTTVPNSSSPSIAAPVLVPDPIQETTPLIVRPEPTNPSVQTLEQPAPLVLSTPAISPSPPTEVDQTVYSTTPAF
jgi:vancomycin resistance protein YoaR